MRYVMLVPFFLIIASCTSNMPLFTLSACDPPLFVHTIDMLDETQFPIRNHTGDQLMILGLVTDAMTCAPLANAPVLFDLANDEGEYDGVQQGMTYTNTLGFFIIRTNYPEYGGGRPHIHLYIGVEGYQPITTSYDLFGTPTMDTMIIPLNRVE